MQTSIIECQYLLLEDQCPAEFSSNILAWKFSVRPCSKSHPKPLQSTLLWYNATLTVSSLLWSSPQCWEWTVLRVHSVHVQAPFQKLKWQIGHPTFYSTCGHVSRQDRKCTWSVPFGTGPESTEDLKRRGSLRCVYLRLELNLAALQHRAQLGGSPHAPKPPRQWRQRGRKKL